MLQTLHLLLELHRLLLSDPALQLDVLLVPAVAISAAGIAILSGRPAPAAYSHPVVLPLMVDGKPSRLRFTSCTRWAQVLAATNVRVIFSPALTSTMYYVAGREQQNLVFTRMLSDFPHAEYYPPLSWDAVCEPKNEVYAKFGSEFMLRTDWIAMPTLESIPAVAAQMLQNRADGTWMLKGNWSYGAMAVDDCIVAGGQCADLQPKLRDLFTKQHQRHVGIQSFEPALQTYEMRHYFLLDPTAASSWRAVLSLRTQVLDDVVSVEQEAPTGGRSLLTLRLCERLMKQRPELFAQLALFGVPVLRLDCGVDAQERAFLSEMCCSGDMNTFTEVHGQNLAVVTATAHAANMWAVLQR